MDGSDDLSHYGVKGMKWGVRRADIQVSGDEQLKRDVKTKAKKHGGTQALTNRELQDVIIRMNLERQYKSLNPGALKKGAQAVQAIFKLGNTANQALSFANSPAGTAMRDQFKKA